MSIKEIHALQAANQWEAIGPLLASYADALFYRESLVYRNLTPAPNGVRLTEDSVFLLSPTRVATKTDEATAPKIVLAQSMAFSRQEPMSDDTYLSITSGIKELVDRMFLALVSQKAVHNWPPTDDVESCIRHSALSGQLYFEGIRCEAHAGLASSSERQGNVPGNASLYQVHLATRISMSVEQVAR